MAAVNSRFASGGGGLKFKCGALVFLCPLKRQTVMCHVKKKLCYTKEIIKN